MSRFFVCGKTDDKKLLVLNKSDWTVESVIPEQLKLIQAQGYSVKVDKDYDFIYDFYEHSKYNVFDCHPCLSKMREKGKFYLPYDNKFYETRSLSYHDGNIVVYCSASSTDIILFSIMKHVERYKLFYKRYFLSDLISDFVKYDTRILCISQYYNICIACITSRGEEFLCFDDECNFVRVW